MGPRLGLLFALGLGTSLLLGACGDEGSPRTPKDTTWRCQKTEEHGVCSCQIGGHDYGVGSCEGYDCCANGTEPDGVTKTCLCTTLKSGETCEQWLSKFPSKLSLVASCPAL